MVQIARLPRYFITDDFHVFDSESGKVLNEYENNSGHLFVSIIDQNGRRTSRFLHQMVYEAFYDEVEEGCVVHHIDEDKKNNNINNLQKMTITEHAKHHMPKKYHDCFVICPQCGKEFLWTEQQQTFFYRNTHRTQQRNKTLSDKPFCSKQCVGAYGAKQRKIFECGYRPNNINVFYNGSFYKTFSTFNDCSLFLQKEFNLTVYRSNEMIRKVLCKNRKQYRGYTFQINE